MFEEWLEKIYSLSHIFHVTKKQIEDNLDYFETMFDCGDTPFDTLNAFSELVLEQRSKKAFRLLRALYDLQNGSPLVENEEQYSKTMQEITEFLNEVGA